MNPIYESFCRSLRDTRSLNRWLMGTFSSRAPFRVLEDDPLTGAFLPWTFKGIVLKTHALKTSRVGRSNTHSNLCQKAWVKTQYKHTRLMEDDKPVYRGVVVAGKEILCLWWYQLQEEELAKKGFDNKLQSIVWWQISEKMSTKRQ